MCVNTLYAVWAAWSLRKAAERARTLVLGRLRDRYLACVVKDNRRRAAALTELMTDIRSVRAGAFAPISEHPLAGAFLLPSGGLGIWALAQYLTPG